MRDRPSIAVLIACHNRKAKTLASLASLSGQEASATLHPVVYDDRSSDGTAEAIRRDYPDAEVLSGSGAAFWAGGMRAAFTHALARGYDFYLWLNDDVVLGPDAVHRLLATHDTLAATGRSLCVVGGALLDPATGEPSYGGIARRRGWNPLQFDRVRPASDAPRPCDTLNGNVVLVPHLTAQRVGGIGTAFTHTLGDLDYGLRVTRAGGWVGLAPGFAGTCAGNTVANRWLNPDLPLPTRWQIVGTPLGLPPRPWLHFARAHGGRGWFVFAPLVYWRLFVPPSLVRAVRHLRSRYSADARRFHVSPS